MVIKLQVWVMNVVAPPHLIVMRSLLANGAFGDASVSTRGPIGRSSSMQVSSEMSRIGRREPRRIAAEETGTAYITSEDGAPDILLGWSAQAMRCCITAYVLI